MKITKTSILTFTESTRDIPITMDEFNRLQNGERVTVVVPHLSADDREFLISGITPEQWNETFKDE